MLHLYGFHDTHKQAMIELRCVQLLTFYNCSSKEVMPLFPNNFHISFLVGPYYGEVLSDIIPMNSCHLLLGRTWLFDNHVIQDEDANTYYIQTQV